MTTLEYLSMPLYKRFFYKIYLFLISIPLGIWKFVTKKIPNAVVKFFIGVKKVFSNIFYIFKGGDYKTRISYLVMGFGQITRGNIIKGLMNLIYQVGSLTFLFLYGFKNIALLGTFGSVASSTYEDYELSIEVSVFHDNSFNILLTSIIAFAAIILLLALWYNQLKEAYNLQNLNRIGRKTSDKQTLNDYLNKDYHKVLLTFPTLGLVTFTIIPLIFMVLVAFNNYSANYQSPKVLFDWVGLYNFQSILGISGQGSSQLFGVFTSVLTWTLVWAFFATFTNYFLGMIVALIINKKGVKFKKLWRTILITTIAVPQFISLLFLSNFLNENTGGMNFLLQDLGLITQNIKFLSDATIAKVTLIVVNMWIGIPYTMLMCSGLLMNIPADLYESARIDGAKPAKMYMKITLPYMLFVTGPYLISSFVGNINNFNVIYLLTGGNPMFSSINGEMINTYVYEAGQTDLLITWLYKIAMQGTAKRYGLASVIGIFVFVIIATISSICYSKINSVKNEGDFQ